MRISDWSSDVCSSDLHRLADEDRAADHHRILPRQIAEPILEQQQAAIGSAGHHPRDTEREAPGADRGQPVDILVGIDRRDRRLFVEMAGQRQLQHDAVISEEHTYELQSIMSISY